MKHLLRKDNTILDYTLIFLVIISIVFYTILFVYYSDKGLDITDESFYILKAQQTKYEIGSTSPFGFITGVLLRLCDNNLALFRVTGYLILLFGAYFFCDRFYIFWNNYILNDSTKKKSVIDSAIILLSSFSAVFYYSQKWLRTPSYNWLLLVAMTIYGGGLFYIAGIKRHKAKDMIIISLAIGVAGFLGFFAKPPIILFLIVLFFIWMIIFKKNFMKGGALKVILLTGFVAFILFLIISLIHFNGIGNIYKNLVLGTEWRLMRTGEVNAVSSILKKYYYQYKSILIQIIEIKLIWALLITSGISILMFKYTGKNRMKINFSKKNYAAMIILISVMFFWMSLLLNYILSDKQFNLYNLKPNSIGVLFLFLTILTYVSTSTLIIICEQSVGKFSLLVKLSIVFTLILIFQLIYVFGTTSPYLRKASDIVFIQIIVILLSVKLSSGMLRINQSILFYLMITMLISISYVTVEGYKNPYRLINIMGKQEYRIKILGIKNEIYLDKNTSVWASNLIDIAQENGWKEQMTLIDLTGGTPGASVVLNAKILGTTWLLGGYAGSDAFVGDVLAKSDRDDLRNAWILTSPDGRRHINENVLKNAGLLFPVNYTNVGLVLTGYREEKQYLWKPNG